VIFQIEEKLSRNRVELGKLFGAAKMHRAVAFTQRPVLLDFRLWTKKIAATSQSFRHNRNKFSTQPQGVMMPKPEPIDYFNVNVLRVSKEKLGDLLAMLAKEGFDARPELVTDIPAFAQRTNHDIKSEDFLAAWVKDHPTFRAKQAVKAFREDGRTNGAAYTALRVMSENGTLKKLGDGNYARADVKHLSAPKKAAKVVPKTKKQYDITNGEFILRYGRRHHGRFNIVGVKETFAKDERNVASVHPTLSDLVSAKRIKKVGDGQYILLNEHAAAKQPRAADISTTEKQEGIING
jgi:hypothetical protein